MFQRLQLPLAFLLFIGAAAAADRSEIFESFQDPARYQQPDVISSQVVSASLVGTDPQGGAILAVDGGRRVSAGIGPPPIGAFLHAHAGQPAVVRLDTVRFPGGRFAEVVSEARIGGLTADQWWDDLGRNEQAAAVARVETQSASTSLIAGMIGALSPMLAQAEVSRTLYVDPAGSDASGDGLSPSTAFQTIGRALDEIPSVVDASWTINLAAGTYPEAVQLRRFVMPAALNTQQLRSEAIVRSIAIVGSGTAILRPPAGQPCISVSGVVLFLDTIVCHVSGDNGISAAGATLVLDDVRLGATAAASHGLYAEDAQIYFGGAFDVEGPFTIGLSIRANTLARTGSRRNPAVANLTFRGIQTQAIFARDGGNLTSAFENGTVRVVDSGQAIYAVLGGRVFLANLPLELENVGIGIAAVQSSSVNVNHLTLTGAMPNPFVRCFLGSYLVLERITAAADRPADTDGSCTVFRY